MVRCDRLLSLNPLSLIYKPYGKESEKMNLSVYQEVKLAKVGDYMPLIEI